MNSTERGMSPTAGITVNALTVDVNGGRGLPVFVEMVRGGGLGAHRSVAADVDVNGRRDCDHTTAL